MFKQIALLSTLLVTVGCGSSGPDENAGTVSVSGTITGLAGDITLALNGSLETFTNNGPYTAETRITLDESYTIDIIESSQGLNCTIENNTGTATDNLIGVNLVCDATEFTAYNLNALAFQEESPSVLTFAFHLVDRYTGTAVDSITKENLTSYLNVLENDSTISPRESFLEVDKLSNYDAEYHTVFVIDISSSLFSEELLAIKNAIKNIIIDENGGSKLLPNQAITVLTFHSQIDTVIENSQDPVAISNAVDAITIGGNSTDLFGGLKAGLEVWENEISLDLLSYGSLILFTDGDHNIDNAQPSSVVSATEGKDIYFIAIGEEADTETLKEFTTSDNIFELDDFDQVGMALQSTFDKIKTFEDGLYVMSYATPKRSGSHDLTITAIDDYPCSMAVTENEQAQINANGKLDNCVDQFTSSFNATGFTDIEPKLTLTGPKTTLVPEILWQAKLRWSHETPAFTWQVTECRGEFTYQPSDDNSAITFTRTDPDFAVAHVMLTEDTTGASSQSYLIMASKQETIDNSQQLSSANLSRICGR